MLKMLQRRARAGWRRGLALTGAYGLVALFITWPLALHLGTHLAGNATGAADTFEFVWSTWWWKHALIDLGQNPAQISVIQWPAGFSFPLLPLMAQSFVAALPLTALAGPVVAYNVVFLLSFVACGLAGYLLCQEVSGDWRAGFLGGLIWLCFPNKLGHAETGHLFQLVVFSFPLAAWAWWRLLRGPSPRRAVYAALTLALASTVHPIYLAYFVLPLVALAVGVKLWQTRRGFFTRTRLRALALAGGLYAAVMLPLVAPLLLAAARGQLRYLTPESGLVELSLDALAFFVPAPHQPLVAVTPLASLARAVVSRENETIGYVGWGPLLLAAVALRRRAGQSRLWLLLGLLGGALALGPLLKVGGALVRVPVESERYALPLPYALLARLPFFEWSRAPGRLSALVQLAVAVLAALGYAALAQGDHRRFWRSRGGLALGSALTVFEALVVWPFPLTPAALPAPVLALAAAPDDRPVLPAPITDNDANLRALYWQTAHAHPLIGGRVYRDVPGGEDRALFLNRLLVSGAAPDVAPAPSAAEQAAVLAAEAGWVLEDTAAETDSGTHAALTARLGPPQSVDASAALFAIPAHDSLPADALVWELGPGWRPLLNGERPVGDQATVYLYSGSARAGTLWLTARPDTVAVRLRATLNGQPVGAVVWDGVAQRLWLRAPLQAGLNVLTLTPEALDPANPPPAASVSALAWEPGVLDGGSTRFGTALEVETVSFPHQVTDTLSVAFQWRVQQAPGGDLHAFLHLLDASGTVAAQQDWAPLAPTYPTSRWQPGELVAESATLAGLAGLPPGDYTLVTGFYTWPDLTRLTVFNAPEVRDERLVLGTVTVAP